MNYKEIFKNITTVVLDVDGVLTNGDIILMPGMQPVRKMNAKDGYAMQLAVRNGIRMAIITGGRSPEVKERLNGLGITDVYLGASSKMESYEDLKMCYDLKDEDKAKEIVTLANEIPYTYCSFISPSFGVKIFVRTDSKESNHNNCFNQLSDFYDGILRVASDKQVKDITRLCFVSWDEDLYLNIVFLGSGIQFRIEV